MHMGCYFASAKYGAPMRTTLTLSDDVFLIASQLTLRVRILPGVVADTKKKNLALL